MKPHPRIRKTIKWCGAAVTVLLVVVWIASGWFGVGGDSGRCSVVVVGNGSCHIDYLARSDRPALSMGSHWGYGRVDSSRAWRWGWSHSTVSYIVPPQLMPAKSGVLVPLHQLDLPLWMFAAVSAATGLAAWRLDTLARRRAKLNLCPKCNYDRTGLRDDADGTRGKCPECGAVSLNT
jgi:hypothetical protein